MPGVSFHSTCRIWPSTGLPRCLGDTRMVPVSAFAAATADALLALSALLPVLLAKAASALRTFAATASSLVVPAAAEEDEVLVLLPSPGPMGLNRSPNVAAKLVASGPFLSGTLGFGLLLLFAASSELALFVPLELDEPMLEAGVGTPTGRGPNDRAGGGG